MKNDPFEHIRRMQEALDRNGPYEHIRRMQKAMDKIYRPSEHFFKQYEQLQQRITEAISWQKRYGPLIDSIQRHEKIIRGSTIGLEMERNLVQMQEWASKLHLKYPHSPIPEDFYPHIEKLSDTINNLVPKEASSDLEMTYTVRRPDLEIENRQPWTWDMLIDYFNLVLSIIAIALSISSSEQLERQHKEEMLQRERYQEEQISQDERQHNELLEQKERHHDELMEQNERHHEELMQYASEMWDLMGIYLPDDQEALEDGDEDAQLPD